MTTTTAPAAGTIAYVVAETGDTFGAIYGVYFDHEQAHQDADAIDGIVSVTEVREAATVTSDPGVVANTLTEVHDVLGRLSPRDRQWITVCSNAHSVVVSRKDGMVVDKLFYQLLTQAGLHVARTGNDLRITD